jgi:hypothetical protein
VWCETVRWSCCRLYYSDVFASAVSGGSVGRCTRQVGPLHGCSVLHTCLYVCNLRWDMEGLHCPAGISIRKAASFEIIAFSLEGSKIWNSWCVYEKIYGFGSSFVHVSCLELHWDEQVRWLCGFCLQIRELSAWFSGWRCRGNPLSANRGWMTSRNSWTLIDSSQGPIPNPHPLTYCGILGPAVLMIYRAQDPASLPSPTTSQIFNYSSCPAFMSMWNREFRVFLIHMLAMCDTHTHAWHDFASFYILKQGFIRVAGVFTI